MMKQRLAIDLFTGLHGFAAGAIDQGMYVIGVDIEDMSKVVGEPKPDNFSLLIQDVLTLHGSQFKDASIIWASPPCQFFSYTAMPWTRAKALAAEVRADPEKLAQRLALFNACFRIQREASEAAGHHVPMVVENVRGAIPWVGRSRWNFGSYHIWGDVPALMPPIKGGTKMPGFGHGWIHPSDPRHTPGLDFTRLAAKSLDDAHKVPGFRFDGSGRSFQSEAVKVASLDGGRRTDIGKGARMTTRDCGLEAEGLKQGGDWFSDPESASRTSSSKSPARKAASARIAKIPFALAQHIAKYVALPQAERIAA